MEWFYVLFWIVGYLVVSAVTVFVITLVEDHIQNHMGVVFFACMAWPLFWSFVIVFIVPIQLGQGFMGWSKKREKNKKEVV